MQVIPFYMYTENEIEHKQTLLNTFNDLNKKYPEWTYTTTEMIKGKNQNMAKLFVYLLDHTMTRIADINVDSDEAVFYQLRDSKPTSPAQWLEAIKAVPGAKFVNGINNQLLNADQLYKILMALDKNGKPTRPKQNVEVFQGNFYRSSALPKSDYELAKAKSNESATLKMHMSSFEGKEFDIKTTYPHVYLMTPRKEKAVIEDTVKTLKALDFVDWPEDDQVYQTVILQQFIKYYRAMVLKVASAKRPLLYVNEVDDAIPTIDALANSNNRIEDWTDTIKEIDNTKAFNHVMNAALISGQWAKEGKHKPALESFTYQDGQEPNRYLYSFVDANFVKEGTTPNAILEVDVIPRVKPILGENGQVLHKADMMDEDEFNKYVKSHRPTASKKHQNNRRKK